MEGSNEVLMLGAAGALCGVKDTWKVRRTIQRGFYPEPSRMGPFRVVPRSELPRLKNAMIAAGYLSADTCLQ